MFNSGIVAQLLIKAISALIILFIITIVCEGTIRLFKIHTQKPPFIIALCIYWISTMAGYIISLFILKPAFTGGVIVGYLFPVVVVISVIGMFRMRRWGLLLLTFTYLLTQVLYIGLRMWTPASLAYWFFILPAYFYYQRMV